MPGMKLVFGLKDGRSVQKELSEDNSRTLWGKKIGDKISGDAIGFAGYEFQVSGGSDYCGFPMRRDVAGPVRKRILAVSGVGLKKIAKGIRVRKTVCGNTIHPKIAQINMRILKEGKEALAPPAAEKPAEAKKEEKTAEKPKVEEKKADAPKKEAPAEKKAEVKAAA